MKSAAVKAITAIADGVSSLLGGSKVKRLEVKMDTKAGHCRPEVAGNRRREGAYESQSEAIQPDNPD